MFALDCTSTASAVCEKHGVSSYPTLKFFPAVAAEPPDAPLPEPVAYSGARSSSGFLKYLEKMDPSYTPPPFDPEFVPDAWNSTEGIVVHLSDEHWDSYFSTISPEGKAVAMFYAPWCGHCRNAKPGFAEASVLFRRSMPFVAVDCTDGGAATCAKYGVESYPQFKYVSPKEQDNDPNKAETVADGAGRSSGDFISFVEKKLDAAAANVKDFSKLRVKQLRKLLKMRGVKCRGCTEKKHFVDKVKKSMHLPLLQRYRTDDSKPRRRKTLMQEKREKALAESENRMVRGGAREQERVFSHDGHFEDELLQARSEKTAFSASSMPLVTLQV